MSPLLPQVSGWDVVKLLVSLGYEVMRQRGSHIRLRRVIAGRLTLSLCLITKLWPRVRRVTF